MKLALLVLLADALVIALTQPTPARLALSAAAVLATGYSALSLFASSTRLRPTATVAYSLGLGLVAVGTSALVLWLLGSPLTESAVLLLGLPIGVFAVLRASSLPAKAGQVISNLDGVPGYSPAERAIARGLVGAFCITLLLVVAFVFLPGPPSLRILGPDGTSETLPDSFLQGAPRTLVFQVAGGAAWETYRVEVALANSSEAPPQRTVPWGDPLNLTAGDEARLAIRVSADGAWTGRVPVALYTTGNLTLSAELWEDAGRLALQTLSIHVT